MSISNELLTLNTTKQNIKTTINLKGVTVNDEPFADYPDKVRLIPNGGGTYESNIKLYLEGRLKNAVIPSGTTTIGKMAFAGCGVLETVTIPSSVTSIEDYAFLSCYELNTITIPSSVTTIGSECFNRCSSLTEFVVPNSVTTIGGGAFYLCEGLKTITIGTGVTSIGGGILSGSTSLESIICLATVPPTLGVNGFSNTNDCPIYVPDNSVLAYQTATHWMNYASRIKGISEM